MTTHQFKLNPSDTLIVTVGSESSSGGASGGGGSGRQEDPSTWPNDMQEPLWGGTRDMTCNPRAVTCVPINIPADIQGKQMLTPSVSEHGSPASTKQAILSRSPGDFANPIAFSEGNTATPSVEVGTHVSAGETIYFCWRFYSRDLNGPSTDASPQGTNYGGGFPK